MVYQRFYRLLQESAKHLLAGRSCSFCQQACENHNLCRICSDAISRQGHYCQTCGFALSSNSVAICGGCLKNPKPYHRLIAACDYQFPVDKAIGQIKFGRQWHLAKALSHLLVEAVKQSYQDEPLPQLMLPIPLHRFRLAERGFNQANLIAKQVAKALPIIVDNRRLTRIKNTPHQIGLKAKARQQNLKGAFAINQLLPKHIALIDDVVTTGSTISEATLTCLKHGAEKIDIWCLAKT